MGADNGSTETATISLGAATMGVQQHADGGNLADCATTTSTTIKAQPLLDPTTCTPTQQPPTAATALPGTDVVKNSNANPPMSDDREEELKDTEELNDEPLKTFPQRVSSCVERSYSYGTMEIVDCLVADAFIV